MNRRSLLSTGLTTVAAVLGGCLDARETPDERTTPATDTESPTPRQSTTPDSDTPTGVVVEDIVVRKAITYESIMGSGGVLAGRDRQYVVASVRGGEELSPSDFQFVTAAETWQPGLPETGGALNSRVADHEGGPVRQPPSDDGSSFLAFTVPSPLTATNPRIRYTGVDGDEWPLPTAAAERLAAAAPAFELTSLDVPETVSQGESLRVTLTARNVSDVDGRFLAAVYWPTRLIADDDESRLIERQVAAGDETTATLAIDTQYTTDEPEPIDLYVRGHVTAGRTVQVQDVSTSS